VFFLFLDPATTQAQAREVVLAAVAQAALNLIRRMNGTDPFSATSSAVPTTSDIEQVAQNLQGGQSELARAEQEAGRASPVERQLAALAPTRTAVALRGASEILAVQSQGKSGQVTIFHVNDNMTFADLQVIQGAVAAIQARGQNPENPSYIAFVVQSKDPDALLQSVQDSLPAPVAPEMLRKFYNPSSADQVVSGMAGLSINGIFVSAALQDFWGSFSAKLIVWDKIATGFEIRVGAEVAALLGVSPKDLLGAYNVEQASDGTLVIAKERLSADQLDKMWQEVRAVATSQ
jgi:hypothetical protein